MTSASASWRAGGGKTGALAPLAPKVRLGPPSRVKTACTRASVHGQEGGGCKERQGAVSRRRYQHAGLPGGTGSLPVVLFNALGWQGDSHVAHGLRSCRPGRQR